MEVRGSSPLARGLHRHLGITHYGGRIIPARAGFTPRRRRVEVQVQDHPRSRGVYAAALPGKWIDGGSSPLARGLRGGGAAGEAGGGIIPARAGFTAGSAGGPRAPPDHPRSRGVYTKRRWPPKRALGSSPLARGLPTPPSGGPHFRGIIPARAGFTGLTVGSDGWRGDHPRSRGVYRPGSRTQLMRTGSSPLARGLPAAGGGTGGMAGGSSPLARGLRDRAFALVSRGWIIPARAGFTRAHAGRQRPDEDHPRSRGVYPGQEGEEQVKPRIIPARAGFTGDPVGRLRRRGDHPRSRGVYTTCSPGRDCAAGSSPLARGLPARSHQGDDAGGIIPARAGFTGRYGYRADYLPDHPRSRGVYADELAHIHGALGIIPARAGFTCAPRGPPSIRRDHPRSRGVYLASAPVSGRSGGSSPLARGLPLRSLRSLRRRGIIPARAGFTRRAH